MGADWTDTEIELVKAGVARGDSARRIAQTLGNGRTRNAVIGILHRKGLIPTSAGALRRARASKPRNKPHGNTQASGKVHRIQQARAKAKAPEAAPAGDDDPDLRGPAWAALVGPAPVALTALETGMCKWPIGEERPFLFCGQAVAHDKASYCEVHARRAVGLGTPSQRTAVRDALRADRSQGGAGLVIGGRR